LLALLGLFDERAAHHLSLLLSIFELIQVQELLDHLSLLGDQAHRDHIGVTGSFFHRFLRRLHIARYGDQVEFLGRTLIGGQSDRLCLKLGKLRVQGCG